MSLETQFDRAVLELAEKAAQTELAISDFRGQLAVDIAKEFPNVSPDSAATLADGLIQRWLEIPAVSSGDPAAAVLRQDALHFLQSAKEAFWPLVRQYSVLQQFKARTVRS